MKAGAARDRRDAKRLQELRDRATRLREIANFGLPPSSPDRFFLLNVADDFDRMAGLVRWPS